MGTTFAGAPHHAGPSLANEGPPCLPIEPVRKEDPDEFRRRMEEKAGRRRLALRSITPEPRPEVDDALQAAKFSPAPRARDDRRAAPRPRPTPATPPAAPSRDERDRLAAIEAYEQGESIVALARRFGQPETTVRHWLTRAGVTLRTRSEQVALSRHAELGDPVRPCAGGCGKMTRPSSYKAADHPDTVSRSRHGMCGACANPDAKHRETTPVERDHWVSLHVEQGRTVPEIADQVGRSEWTVRHALAKAGVKIRSGNAIQVERRAAGAPDAAPPPPGARKDPSIAARNERIVEMVRAEPHTPARVIAARFGVNAHVIDNVLTKAGVRRRDLRRAARPADPAPSRPPAAPSAPAPLSSPPAPEVHPDATPDVALPAVAVVPDRPRVLTDHDRDPSPAAAYTAMRAAVVDLTTDLLDAAAHLASAGTHLTELRTAVLDLLAALPEGPTS